jgi:hypothetical protein
VPKPTLVAFCALCWSTRGSPHSGLNRSLTSPTEPARCGTATARPRQTVLAPPRPFSRLMDSVLHPALAGLLTHRDDDGRRAEQWLCTLQVRDKLFTAQRVDTLLSVNPPDTARLTVDLRQAVVYAAEDSTALVLLVGELRHRFGAAGGSLAGETIECWRQRLAALCSGTRELPANAMEDARRSADAGSVAQWLQLARDGQRARMVRAYRSCPGLLDTRASTGACLGALHWAAAKAAVSKPHRDCLHWLLRVGARTDLPDARPVLHAARTVGVARLLVTFGADPAVTDQSGRTASEAARADGLDELAQWLDSAVRRVHHSAAPPPEEHALDADGHGDGALGALYAQGAVRSTGPRQTPNWLQPPVPVVEVRGIGAEADGWYSLVQADATSHAEPTGPTYSRVRATADDPPAVLSYCPPAPDELSGWWFIAGVSPQELQTIQVNQKDSVPSGGRKLLASVLVAVANDSAGSPERICAGWQLRIRTGEGEGTCQRLGFCGGEPSGQVEVGVEAEAAAGGLLIDTVCCGAATIGADKPLYLPLAHRSAVEFLLTTVRWHQLGLSSMTESDSTPRAQQAEAHAFLQGAVERVKAARQSRVYEEQALDADLLLKMERLSPLSVSAQGEQGGQGGASASASRQRATGGGMIDDATREQAAAGRWWRRCNAA